MCRHFAKVIQKFHRARPRSVNLDSIRLDIATIIFFSVHNICHCMILSKNIIQSQFFIHWLFGVSYRILSIQPPLTAANTMLQRFAIDIVIVQETTYIGFVDDLDLWYLQVAVRVHNRLQTEGVSFHWHGLLQRGTPWMDGVPMVSQCPILPGQVFQYRWAASFQDVFISKRFRSENYKCTIHRSYQMVNILQYKGPVPFSQMCLWRLN